MVDPSGFFQYFTQLAVYVQSDRHTLLSHSRFYVSTMLFVLLHAVSLILGIDPFRPGNFISLLLCQIH